DDSDGDGVCDDQDACVGADASGDLDNDGHCLSLPNGTVWDCDDTDPTVYRQADELLDGIDNDCDGYNEDSDGDGIPNDEEIGDGGVHFDTDEDGVPDFLDDDDDGDGIPTDDENGDYDWTDPNSQPTDTDGDDIPDYLDEDSDGDGLTDLEEGTGDVDCDGLANYVDPVDDDRDCEDGDPRDLPLFGDTGTIKRVVGSGCDCDSAGGSGPLGWLALFAAVAVRRRKLG
ncbi:MAG: hypothetical protein GWP91_08150, partial [Rhodobacterales bacterium]|nr:hypothetical protein [Rhodobacterales bacterium]